MRLIILVFALLLLIAPHARAQTTGCTPTSVSGTMTALADNQAPASITPRVIRNILCAHTTNVTAVSGTTYSALGSDQLLCVSPTAATTITLAATPVVGQIQTVIDCGGAAGTNNIIVQPASGTIEGYANVLMNVNYQHLAFQYTGSTWVLR